MSNLNDEKKEIENIELLLDKKIADAKLIITEKRLHYLITIGAALLAIFGIVIPLFLTQTSTNRVDQAIERMDEKFNELAGKQLRKPKIACYVDGKPLENSTIIFDPDNLSKTIIVKNIGDGTADYIRMRLYTNSKDPDLKRDINNTGFWDTGISDKPDFNSMMTYEYKINLLPAQDSKRIYFNMQNLNLRKEDLSAAAILMIFYGEPRPLEIPFIFHQKRQKSQQIVGD